ncbi:hypothetical protein [Nocardia macrotermitis]|uniref:Mce-associated membrane protein n=1 Tax=Nocardia macrotermitis TaxID=2585198 RepID=A0A7K0CXU6_9NOCA|nr:hypothetical protein [Nocardia macrotermitis]MQY18317.1 hypothetical protein [Nocardia macrotermitis]
MSTDLSNVTSQAAQIPPEEVDSKVAADSSGTITEVSEVISGPSVLRTVVTCVAAVWLVAALVAAAWFGVGWVRAGFFTDAPRAQARDTALDAARQAALNLSSMNPDDVDGSIKLMQSSMTGQMLDEFNQNHDRIKETAQQAKTRLDAKILGASLTSLNSERDKASALVVVQQTQTAPNVLVQSFRATWTLDLTKVGGLWKTDQANSLGDLVPLDNAGSNASAAQPQASSQPGASTPAPAPSGTPAPAPQSQPGS